MAGKPIKCIGGDFIGDGTLNFGVLWSGPQADKFQGFSFKLPKASYAPSDLAKLSELQQEQLKSFTGTAIAAGAGMLLLGGIGLVTGALAGGKKNHVVVGVEFKDGKKAAFSVDPTDKPYICARLYAMQNGLIQHNF